MRPEEGSRLKAFVVLRQPGADEDALRAGLAAHVEALLPPPERPRAFTFGPAVPLTPMGKPADWPAWPSERG
jgi:acyl-coenzyme A synthetase/AMP-(fatty) acid ligase